MRKDPKVGGGVGGTCKVTINQTQHSPRLNLLQSIVQQLVIAVVKNSIHLNRTKHSAIKYHVVIEACENKETRLEYYTTED
ncbi:hypothetical protein Lal_00018768 [Lupinus albus]|nr:hypothetical protein Lal_00018768 [Lupinus albus]